MGKKRIVKVGLDFDGVVAYNPFRLIRAPVKWFKAIVLGQKKVSFVVPSSDWEKWVWTIVHESSVFPATGVGELKNLASQKKYEFHLITARFGFLEKNLYKWLKKNRLDRVFKSVTVNRDNQQPHEYKLEKIRQMKLDYFVEDNLDIVTYLHKKTPTKIHWIYNLIDRQKKFEHKFPYLLKALEKIKSETADIN